MTWDVLDTDVPRSYQYTYDCWMRSTRVHADWGRSGGLTRDSRLFLRFHPCMIADVLPDNQHIFSAAYQGKQKKCMGQSVRLTHPKE